MPLTFNADRLPDTLSEYLAWVDVMGTQVSMSRSIKITANFIFKLHIAALRADNLHLRIYPVMDGFYVASADKNHMLNFLRSVFSEVAAGFNATPEPQHRFLIRGGLAFGPVIHGNGVGACANELQNDETYRNAILLGTPMVQAHLSEQLAPPFGMFVHESARVFAPSGVEPLHWIWWKWGSTGQATWDTLKVGLPSHLQWCEKRAQAILYDPNRIEAHKKMVDQYFES
jgi:hypothetical protein